MPATHGCRGIATVASRDAVRILRRSSAFRAPGRAAMVLRTAGRMRAGLMRRSVCVRQRRRGRGRQREGVGHVITRRDFLKVTSRIDVAWYVATQTGWIQRAVASIPGGSLDPALVRSS